MLTELKNSKRGSWWKHNGVMAAENCLLSRNCKMSSTGSMTKIESKLNPNNDDFSIISPSYDRKDDLYEKIIAPFRWLATTDFKHPEEEIPSVSLNRIKRHGSISTQNHELQRCGSWDTPDSMSSFLTSSMDGKLDFIEGFRSVAHHIQLSRKKAKVSRRTRIAILDTGCKTDNIPFFADSARSERLKNWEDFVTPKSSTKADTSGHGTLMTQLIMRIAPTADIYVIRVAENNHDLQAKGHAIAKVRATPASLAEMLTLD